mmetsp:Transcript_5217/g.11617  ORF Transcript_5217/g.11617 Transcript_5217/m.11617 type:complete len:297 (+) Transcript_5217:61-951(+)
MLRLRIVTRPLCKEFTPHGRRATVAVLASNKPEVLSPIGGCLSLCSQQAVPVPFSSKFSFSVALQARGLTSAALREVPSSSHPSRTLQQPISPAVLSKPTVAQARFAGRLLGCKRKRKNCRTRTVHQKGLGKRMEFKWIKRAPRTRVPMYENSRRHVIWDHHKRRWMVMWYRHGIQVFRTFSARANSHRWEQSRQRAIIFYNMLKQGGKLGRPKPDQCRSGVRGVFFDKEERAWVARWNDMGLKKFAVFSTEDHGFSEAYTRAVQTRVQHVRQQHQFMFQRTRWRGQRQHFGSPRT